MTPTLAPLCSLGCGRARSRRGLCAAHYEQRRTRDTAYGRWETMYTDAGPVRAHVEALQAAGMGTRTIAETAGVSRQNVQQLLNGRPERGLGPSRKVMRRIAERLLAVPVPEVPHAGVAGGARVPAVGTVRRLRALVAIGWTQTQLCDRLGWRLTNGSRLFRAEAGMVTADTARSVADLFGVLQMVPGSSQRARNQARRAGWAAPMAWDEDTIDDPAARPDRTPATKGGFIERYLELTELGYGQIDCARRMGITFASLRDQLQRHGLPIGEQLRDLAHEQRKRRSA